MCGIVGLISNDDILSDDIVLGMLSSIEHRGRDGQGILRCGKRVVLGHTRLSIIDTSSAGSQPYVFKNLTLTFNGEVYNYIELKNSLLQEGVSFETQSDTEVLIKLIYYKGIDSLARIEGMFALALHDANENKVYLARDYFGEKPLFYTVLKNGSVLFSSEIKAIFSSGIVEKRLCSSAVNQFLTLLYTHGENTFYDNIKACLPNTVISIDLTDKNSMAFRIIDRKNSSISSNTNWKKAIVESVSRQLRADVPKGLWLSGGVDSSIIAAIAREELGEKLQTFTVGFKNSKFLDEKDDAQRVSKQFIHDNTVLNLDSRFSEEELLELIKHMDNPVANASILLYNRLSIESRKHIKVALTGVGGDELFSGYNRYRAFNFHTYLLMLSYTGIRLPLKYFSRIVGGSRMTFIGNSTRAINKMLSSIDWDKSKYYYNLIDYSHGEIEFSNIRKVQTFRDAMENDLATYLPGDLLYLGDLFSMKNNLETRAPFLNKILYKNVSNLNSLGKPGNKDLLVNYLNELYKGQYKPIAKRGFSMPIEPFLKGKGREELHKLFIKADLMEYVSDRYYKLVLDGFFQRKEDWSNQLLSFYILANKRLSENI